MDLSFNSLSRFSENLRKSHKIENSGNLCKLWHFFCLLFFIGGYNDATRGQNQQRYLMETWCGNCIWHLTIQTFTYLKSSLEKVFDIILVSLFKNSRELFLLYCWFEHISHLFLVFLLFGLNKFFYNTSFFWLSVASRWNFANIDNWISFFFF